MYTVQLKQSSGLSKYMNVATGEKLLCSRTEVTTTQRKIVTGFWKTYHLHTSEIIRISKFSAL